MADFREALGRGTDTMMGHLTPGEAVIPVGTMTPKLWSAFTEALGSNGMSPEQYIVGSGENSVNPYTGQPEFLSFSGSGPGPDAPERADFSFSSANTQGGFGAQNALDRTTNEPMVNPQQEAQVQIQSGLARAAGAAAPDVAAADWNPPASPTDPWTYDQNVSMAPFLNVLAPGAGSLLELLGADLNLAMEVDPLASYGARRAATQRESENSQGLSAQRAATQAQFMRPEIMPAPQFLGLSSAMTPLQMRTAIASRAVAGQQGEYTSPEAGSFYDNLLQRALIGDTGELMGLDTLMPIDLQYLGQIRGIENPADTSALLTALQAG